MTTNKSPSVIAYVNGKRFFCECGAGVFSEVEHPDYPLVYECNACTHEYAATPSDTKTITVEVSI